jgi:hypothetical protein
VVRVSLRESCTFDDEFVPLSNSQFDNLVSDLCNDDSDFDDILKTLDTTKMINVNIFVGSWTFIPHLSILYVHG